MSDRDDHRPSDLLDRATRALRDVPVPDGPPLELLASTVAAVRSLEPPLHHVPLGKRKGLIFCVIRYGGAAAAVALVALIGYFWLTDRRTGIAFGNVVDKVKNAQSVSYVMAAQLGQGPGIAAKWYQQDEAVRVEIPQLMVVVADFRQNKAVQLDLLNKRAFRWQMDERSARTFRQAFRDPVEVLGRLTDHDAEKIGEGDVKGRKAVIYRVGKAELFGIRFEEADDARLTVWVDPQTELPMQIALQCSAHVKGKTKDWFLWKDFRWNRPLNPGLFKLGIPKGFAVIEREPGPDYAIGHREVGEPTVVEKQPGPGFPDKEIAFTEVIENVNQAKSMTCKVNSAQIGEERGMGAELYVQASAVRRNSVVIQIEDWKQGKAVQFPNKEVAALLLRPEFERAYRWNLDKKFPTDMARRFPNPMLLFRNMKGEDAEKVRETRLKGRTALVYRVNRADLEAISVEPEKPFDTELFVVIDPQTGLPARITLSLLGREERKQKAWYCWEDFQWDKPLDPGLFKLDVPEEYTLIEGPPPSGAPWLDLGRIIGVKRAAEK